MKKEELKKVYDAPSKEFHDRVVNTLDSLEETSAKHTRRINRRMVAALCAAVIVLAAFTVTAAATGLFGLIASKRGEYGLDVTVANSETSDSTHQSMKLELGYLPEQYKDGKSDSFFYTYQNGDTYFNAWVYYTDYYYDDLSNVVKTEEKEYDGHKTLIITFKEAKNTDKMYYATIKYFDKENCVVQCNGSDYDELIKITEKVNVLPDLEPAAPKDVRNEDEIPSGKAISEYLRDGDGFRVEFFSGNVQEAKPGDSVDLSVADYDEKPVHLTAKLNSVKEQDNIDGLDLNDFINLGTETTYSHYFNSDGTLIKKEEFTVNDDADDYDLGTARTVTLTRHFYVADIELTAQDDIDDLRKAFEPEVYYVDVAKKYFYGYLTPDYESVLRIYCTNINTKQPMKKGETLKIKMGFIADNDTADNAYIIFSAVDAPNDFYQNYMIKVKE